MKTPILSDDQKTIAYLTSQFANSGKVQAISFRPERREPPQVTQSILAIENEGLEGDHYSKKGGNRQVTLIQAEHLQTVASYLQKEEVDPMLTRRNIVTRGINLLALKDKQFKIGEAILEYTGECHPCSRMEENLGHGGYNAMRGHGGITARVVKSGEIRVGDSLEVIS